MVSTKYLQFASMFQGLENMANKIIYTNSKPTSNPSEAKRRELRNKRKKKNKFKR